MNQLHEAVSVIVLGAATSAYALRQGELEKAIWVAAWSALIAAAVVLLKEG